MSRKQVFMILLILAVSIGVISLYTTFAYDEEAATLDESVADYNLVYQIKDSSNKNVFLKADDEVYVDIVLSNIYDSLLKYGVYYKYDGKSALKSVIISLSDDSVSSLQGIIKPNETKTISLKVKNLADNNANLTIGALVGFEQGNIEDLIREGEILIK